MKHMTSLRPDRFTAPVLAAAVTLMVLAGALGVRVAARGREGGSGPVRASHATATERLERTVPQPRPIVVSELPTPPCWSCDWNDFRPLEFTVDLDHLAPLGTGDANAARWLADFASPSGARVDDAEGHLVEIEIEGQTWKVFPADDPLLREAEPWVDQQRCRFYPDVWQVAGVETSIPNVQFTLTLARSWVARGKLAADPGAAAEDYRRAIRLGRLLRQDDATLIQDLVAIALIRMGTEAIYEQARSRGDAATMTLAAIVLADHGAMRNRTAQRVTVLKHVYEELRRGADGAPVLGASDTVVDAALDLVRRVSERRFALEGLFAVQLVRQLGTAEQRLRAEALLDELAAGKDELVARRAREVRGEPEMTGTQLDAMIEALSH
jgi:hypothetical protein